MKDIALFFSYVGFFSFFTFCIPPGGKELEDRYRAERAACDHLNQKEACYCRVAVDEKWRLCDHPEWPRIGRCDFRCE